MAKPTHLDLFSGIGGFAIAAQSVGYETIGFSEIEPYACAILKRHWPHVRNYGDIRNVPVIECDLITGGFPCQPYSVAGQRRGKADDRALWPEMRRVIAECRPRWLLAENVPGIIGMELDDVLSDLEGIGYTTGTLVVPACAVDARHRRDRVWIVAHSNESGPQGRRRSELSECADKRVVGANGSPIPNSKSDGRRKRHSDTGGGGAGTRTEKQWARPSDPRRWLPEPELGRVVNGLPNRAHRLRGLGNAIVPQVAAEILAITRQTFP